MTAANTPDDGMAERDERKSGGVRGAARRLYRRLRGGALTPSRAGLSVGAGVFIGCLPLYGLHLPLCALVCLPLRLDLVTCYLAANISNPLFAPFLLIAEVQLGSWLLHGHGATPDRGLPVAELVGRFALELAVGAPLVGAGLALVLAGIAYWVVERRQTSDPRLDAAIHAVSERYRTAPPKHGYYVRAKLRFDPLTRELREWKQLGHVVDLGCGRGQFALLLLELGAATRVSGYDYDDEKITVARHAATGLDSATFHVATIEDAASLRADSVLLLDVLHYLSRDAQRELLERVARELPAHGRLYIREASPAASPNSALTRFAERVGRRLRLNRARQFQFVEARELSAILERLGLECQLSDASEGTPLDNYLLTCRRASSSSESEPAPAHEEG